VIDRPEHDGGQNTMNESVVLPARQSRTLGYDDEHEPW
jgi:hypothetical protein